MKEYKKDEIIILGEIVKKQCIKVSKVRMGVTPKRIDRINENLLSVTKIPFKIKKWYQNRLLLLKI